MTTLAHFPADADGPEGFDLVDIGNNGPEVVGTALVADPMVALDMLGVRNAKLVPADQPSHLLGLTWGDPYDAAWIVERSRFAAHRDRKRGALPRPPQPCGTYAAFRRHQRRAEPIDDACRAAYNAIQRANYAKRKPAP